MPYTYKPSTSRLLRFLKVDVCLGKLLGGRFVWADYCSDVHKYGIVNICTSCWLG